MPRLNLFRATHMWERSQTRLQRPRTTCRSAQGLQVPVNHHRTKEARNSNDHGPHLFLQVKYVHGLASFTRDANRFFQPAWIDLCHFIWCKFLDVLRVHWTILISGVNTDEGATRTRLAIVLVAYRYCFPNKRVTKLNH